MIGAFDRGSGSTATYRGSVRCGVALSLLVSSATFAAAPGDIQVKVRNCKAGVELVARDAPLARVLERLAESLAFQLHIEAPADNLVNLHLTARAPDLITAVAGQDRVMVSQARDPRCPGQSRVVKVWLLPKGESRAALPSANTTRTPVTETATRDQLRAHEERSRQLKQEYDAYVKTHGRPPPGEEQEEARR